MIHVALEVIGVLALCRMALWVWCSVLDHLADREVRAIQRAEIERMKRSGGTR